MFNNIRETYTLHETCAGDFTNEWIAKGYTLSRRTAYAALLYNRSERAVVEYVEGDVFITTCTTIDDFNEQLRVCEAFADSNW